MALMEGWKIAPVWSADDREVVSHRGTRTEEELQIEREVLESEGHPPAQARQEGWRLRTTLLNW